MSNRTRGMPESVMLKSKILHYYLENAFGNTWVQQPKEYGKCKNFFVSYMNQCRSKVACAMLFTPSMKEASGIDFRGTRDSDPTPFVKEWTDKPEYKFWLKLVLMRKLG